MKMQETQRVSAADFIRGFASWRLQAARKPVVVTHHGKDAHVLISLDDYRRLDAGTVAADDLKGSLADLAESIRDGIIVIDRERRILAVNPAASDMMGEAAALLLGRALIEILPRVADNILFGHINRMLDLRERFSGDVPGLLRPHQWLHIDLVPLATGGALVLRDISAAMEAITAGDTRKALADAIDAHGSIGHATVSVREMVEDASDALTAMAGVDATAIRRVRFSALLATGERHAFTEALEEVFRTGAPARLASSLVTRDGVAIPVTLSIAERRGVYASEGAVVVVTPC
ncbi:PAS domain-containing protein [Sphingopyxis sp.]|uniref:PAS domain-containing protein n=1 Tax=Sphingopyxis sp. TaxID=1908224 RepID=UPI003D0AC307